MPSAGLTSAGAALFVKGNADQLQASVAGTRAVQNGVGPWWARKGLAFTRRPAILNGRQPPKERLLQLQALGSPPAAHLHSSPAPTEAPPAGCWRLWQPLAPCSPGSLAGRPIANDIDGLGLQPKRRLPQTQRPKPALRVCLEAGWAGLSRGTSQLLLLRHGLLSHGMCRRNWGPGDQQRLSREEGRQRTALVVENKLVGLGLAAIRFLFGPPCCAPAKPSRDPCPSAGAWGPRPP